MPVFDFQRPFLELLLPGFQRRSQTVQADQIGLVLGLAALEGRAVFSQLLLTDLTGGLLLLEILLAGFELAALLFECPAGLR